MSHRAQPHHQGLQGLAAKRGQGWHLFEAAVSVSRALPPPCVWPQAALAEGREAKGHPRMHGLRMGHGQPVPGGIQAPGPALAGTSYEAPPSVVKSSRKPQLLPFLSPLTPGGR